jgi:hypothetical protein
MLVKVLAYQNIATPYVFVAKNLKGLTNACPFFRMKEKAVFRGAL